ncbi:PKD domain-containing protein, partial [Pseudomonas viridiflava]|uniref:PKD domain-containing protein n=1 Tax=Pseudomonas viridiflava TaxID=33069 RepID=UPI000F057664
VCTLDAGSSSDSDGTLASYTWDFGDGTSETTTSATTTHTYDAGGSITARVTVTDNDGGTDAATRTVTAVAIRPIALVGTTANQGNVSTPNTV